MKIDRHAILNIIEDCLNKFCLEYELKFNFSDGENTRLFGSDGILDSLGLVSFIVTLEETLEEKLGVIIVLADEKAMSRRTSPFVKVSYLADYILEIINITSNEE